MKLMKLKIHGYRDVAPGTELVFSPSATLVLGENGTGRTTLLELLALVLCSDFSGLIHETFSLEYTLAFPGMTLHIAVRNARPSSPTPPEAGNSALLPLRTPEPVREFEPLMEVTLQLEAPASRMVLRADASGVSWEVDGQPAWSQSMRWSLLDRTVWIVLFMTAQYLEPQVKDRLKELLRRTFLLAPTRFDEALGTFTQIGKSQYGMEMRGDEVFPLGLMGLPTWMPGLLRERVERGLPGEFIDIHPEDVRPSFLTKFITLAGFSTGRFRVELLDKRSYEGGGRLEFGRFGFDFTRSDGRVLTQEQLGQGQRRLLSFLYYLDVNEDFVIADELTNGLHPRWLEACLRELDDRQCFLTSQNPLLFEHVPLDSPEDVRASLIHCGVRLHEGRTQWAWSNPPEELATKLFRASREGATSRGALLKAHGLW
jgi:energy-coupling factor transporter ATP-binding protein EcfA2